MVSDDALISSLIANNGSIRKSADELSISESTVYNKLKKKDFATKYRFARADQQQVFMQELNTIRLQALRVIQELAEDKSQNGKVRLESAKALLGLYDKTEFDLENRYSDAIAKSKSWQESFEDFD